MSQERVRGCLEQVASGDLSVEQALVQLEHLPFEDVGFARIDHHRALRQGAAEVVYGAGKTPEQIAVIADRMLQRGSNVLVTRAPAGTLAAVQRVAPDAVENALASLVSVERSPPPPLGTIAVVCAGTSDLPVAEEAAACARFFGLQVRQFVDVGVAGLHRILAVRQELRAADAVIVVAGMDGALPSVVGGLVTCPVIAVPTAVGYGASFQGVAALLTMLNSCAAGVLVVNIDNGFGAAHAAFRMAATHAQARETPPPSSTERRD